LKGRLRDEVKSISLDKLEVKMKSTEAALNLPVHSQNRYEVVIREVAPSGSLREKRVFRIEVIVLSLLIPALLFFAFYKSDQSIFAQETGRRNNAIRPVMESYAMQGKASARIWLTLNYDEYADQTRLLAEHGDVEAEWALAVHLWRMQDKTGSNRMLLAAAAQGYAPAVRLTWND
jgi:hypothetical protein